MKYFRMSYEEVVFNRSYLNILLLNHSIPSLNLDKDKEEKENGRELVKSKEYSHESQLFMSLM